VLLAAAGTVGLAHYARHTAPYRPVLERVDVVVPAKSATDGELHAGFVADVHIGPTMGARDADRALSLLWNAEPELLLLGGDYISESPRYAVEAAAILGEYASRARLGAFAVLGNHDYSNDAPRLTRLLERRGIRVLRNEAACVSADKGDLWIAGIDDALLGAPDLKQAFSGIPDNSAVLALWHEPDWAAKTAEHCAFLQLSGHSHGGQVRLPVLSAAGAPPGGRRFVSGMNQVDGMGIYTSRGLGLFRPPVRWNCPPEVTLVQLRFGVKFPRRNTVPCSDRTESQVKSGAKS
jgi:predicted MPP superfamily phosphohydrolase